MTPSVKLLAIIRVRGMDRTFRGRKRKNQPASACIDGAKPEDVPKKCAICFWILAVKQDMSSDEHGRNLWARLTIPASLAGELPIVKQA
jgi:hypothetical protein